MSLEGSDSLYRIILGLVRRVRFATVLRQGDHEGLVGVVDALESLRRGRVAPVPIRVVLETHLLVGLLELRFIFTSGIHA